MASSRPGKSSALAYIVLVIIIAVSNLYIRDAQPDEGRVGRDQLSTARIFLVLDLLLLLGVVGHRTAPTGLSSATKVSIRLLERLAGVRRWALIGGVVFMLIAGSGPRSFCD